jgi:hypothetical protein
MMVQDHWTELIVQTIFIVAAHQVRKELFILHHSIRTIILSYSLGGLSSSLNVDTRVGIPNKEGWMHWVSL